MVESIAGNCQAGGYFAASFCTSKHRTFAKRPLEDYAREGRFTLFHLAELVGFRPIDVKIVDRRAQRHDLPFNLQHE
jgi:hypothetical protein